MNRAQACYSPLTIRFRPRAAALRARIGRGSVIAAGAVVLPGIEIGSNSVIAAGAVVRERAGDHCLVAGVPASVVRQDYPGFRELSV